MTIRAHRSFFAIAAILVAACSSSSSDAPADGGHTDGGGGGGPPGSCMAGKNSCSTGTEFCCADYAGNFTPASVKDGCDISGGTYSASTCASANREGSCTLY